MLKAYKYFFYQFYQYAKVVEAKHSEHGGIPHYVAFLSVCMVMFYNLITVFAIVHQVLGLSVSFRHEHALVIALVFIGLNYLALLHNKSYVKIDKEFSKIPPAQKKKNKYYFWAFLVSSIVLFFALLPLLAAL